jgi:hypothetical protein
VSERPKERASKAREGQPSAGSNPAATASLARPNAGTAARLAPAFSLWSQLVPIGVSLPDHRRPSSRLARSLWIGVITACSGSPSRWLTSPERS